MKAPQLVLKEKEIHVIAVGMQGPPGNGGGVTLESVSVWNNGDPQIVFTKTGDVVTNDVT